jgi:nicotinate-nucleotide adenylyltransferase
LNAPLGILGGTFDPIHNGHLRLALDLRDSLGLAEIRIIPNAHPPHREAPIAPAEQRASWIRAAIEGESGLVLDERELSRIGPSYTVDTLRSLREENPAAPLCLILGMDAFAGFRQWREPDRIIELAHLVLVPRPGSQVALGYELGNLLAERTTEDPARLARVPAGLIHRCAVTPLEISAQGIRALLAAGKSVRYLVPDAVCDAIERSGCYVRPPSMSHPKEGTTRC